MHDYKNTLTNFYCTEPDVLPTNPENQPEQPLNIISDFGLTYKVYLPVIRDTNGPFRLVLILTGHFVTISPKIAIST